MYSSPSGQGTQSGLPSSVVQPVSFRVPGGHRWQQNLPSRCRPFGHPDSRSVMLWLDSNTSELILVTWILPPLDNGPAIKVTIRGRRTPSLVMAGEQRSEVKDLLTLPAEPVSYPPGKAIAPPGPFWAPGSLGVCLPAGPAPGAHAKWHSSSFPLFPEVSLSTCVCLLRDPRGNLKKCSGGGAGRKLCWGALGLRKAPLIQLLACEGGAERGVRVCCTNGHSPFWGVSTVAWLVRFRWGTWGRLAILPKLFCSSDWEGWGGLKLRLELWAPKSCLVAGALANCWEQSVLSFTQLPVLWWHERPAGAPTSVWSVLWRFWKGKTP